MSSCWLTTTGKMWTSHRVSRGWGRPTGAGVRSSSCCWDYCWCLGLVCSTNHDSLTFVLFFFTSLVPAYKTLVVSLSPGFLVGNASGVQRGPKNSNGRDAYQDNTEDGVPKFRPSPVTHLFWRNISQLLKQKLTSKAFDETLPYVRPHPLPHTEGVDSAETLNPI